MRKKIRDLLMEVIYVGEDGNLDFSSDEENMNQKPESIRSIFSQENFDKQQRGIPTKGKMERKQSTPIGDLVLEINPNVFGHEPKDFKVGNVRVMVTPNVNEDYWLFRVKLHKDQAIIGFPKFGLVGIGFAQEKDWNTNLPSDCSAKEIFDHIKHNKKYRSITDEKVIEAIKMVRAAAKQYKNKHLN